MDDPLVVDAFVESLQSLRKSDIEHQFNTSIVSRHETPIAQLTLPPIQSHPTAALRSLELLCAMAPFPAGPSASALARQALSHVRAIAQCDTAILFVYEPHALELVPLMVDSASGASMPSTRIALAQRLTGWVAAYQKAVWNSDASLDLGLAGQTHGLVLASALPLVQNDAPIGVLTMYGKPGQEVSLAQRKALEDTSRAIAASLSEAIERSPLGIEGRRLEVRAAALSALESVLSHSSGEAANGVVVIAHLEKTARPSSQKEHTSPDLGLRLLLAAVLTHRAPRQFLVLSDRSCVIYEYTASGGVTLVEDVATAMRTEALQDYKLELSRVRPSWSFRWRFCGSVRLLALAIRGSAPSLRCTKCEPT